MLESALEAGFSAAGVDVHMCGPMPTPAVAYLTRALRLSAGVVISASHNPYADNGIKFFSGDGFKLPDEVEAAIEAEMEQPMACNRRRSWARLARRDDAGGPLHRVLQVDLSERARSQGPAAGGRLRARRGVQRRAARVPRARRRRHRASASSPTASTSTTGSAPPRPPPSAAGAGAAGRPRHRAWTATGTALVLVDASGRLYDGDQLLYAIAKHRASKGKVSGVAGTLMTNLAFENAHAAPGHRVRPRRGGRSLRARDDARERLGARRRELRPHHLPRQAHHRRRHRLGAAGAARHARDRAPRSPSSPPTW